MRLPTASSEAVERLRVRLIGWLISSSARADAATLGSATPKRGGTSLASSPLRSCVLKDETDQRCHARDGLRRRREQRVTGS